MKTTIKNVWNVGVLAGLLLIGLTGSTPAVQFDVTNNSSSASDSGSLPWAVAQANINAGTDQIVIDAGITSITVRASLVLQDTVQINGNNVTVGTSNPAMLDCIIILSTISDCVISNLNIVDSNSGIRISGSSARTRIYNCRIGTDAVGATNRGNTVGIYNTGIDTYIGGESSAYRNVISNNSQSGIDIYGAHGCKVYGNYIGTNLIGTGMLGTQSMGVRVRNSSYQNIIGGNKFSSRGNLISGNTYGVYLEGAGCSGNTVCGNIIGLDEDLSDPISNVIAGIYVNRACGNFIGLGGMDGGENIIAGNGSYGIYFYGVGGTRPSNNVIQNNFIGVTNLGAVFGNLVGIRMDEADGNLIGGRRNSLERNVIAGNQGGVGFGGLYLIGDNNVVAGNYIGVYLNTPTARANNNHGITLEGSNNLIGGINGASQYGNIISGNAGNGIHIAAGAGNSIAGNYVGLSAGGMVAVANGGTGIFLAAGTSQTLVGGGTGAGNVIAGNNGYGLSAAGTQDRIYGNYFDCNAAGTASLANDLSLRLEPGSQSAWVENNCFANSVDMRNAQDSVLVGNSIGRLPNGAAIFPALAYGLTMEQGASDNYIGVAHVLGNLIVNTNQGVVINGSTTLRNHLYTNTITAFSGQGIVLQNSGNAGRPRPGIFAASMLLGIDGSAQPNDTIEVFYAERRSGQGGSMKLLNWTTADGSGYWHLAPGGYLTGDYLCAVATDASGNSSEFSENFVAIEPTATATTTPTYTISPTPTTTPTITQTATHTRTATISPTPTCTPTMTGTASITPTLTDTGTPTLTSTPTQTATASPSATRSVTLTASPTSTPTATPGLPVINFGGKAIRAFPNPAKNHVTFAIDLPVGSEIELWIYNFHGETVARLQGSITSAWQPFLRWDCQGMAPGIYLVRMRANGQETGKIKIAIVKQRFSNY